jgi:hypothetical protein
VQFDFHTAQVQCFALRAAGLPFWNAGEGIHLVSGHWLLQAIKVGLTVVTVQC